MGEELKEDIFAASATTGEMVPRTTAAELPPTPAGRYALGEEIARGGMGVVYRATDTALDREVAVKVLHERFGPESGAGRRFANEARITGQLQHPAIPPVHDLGTLPDGRPFLAMKLIKGDTLDALLRFRSDPPAERGRFVAAFEQVCQALAYAHARKVIHRDLKPANVMVGSFGEVQVMDWGLAKVLTSRDREGAEDDPEATTAGTLVRGGSDSDDDRTQAGSVLGTPAFMPPEQAIGAIDQIDQQSDVFGLGAILCAILTGKPPYAGADAESTRQLAARARLEDAMVRLDGCGAEPELVALCKRCLSAEKSDRPADAGEVASAVAAHRAAAAERARQAELDRVKILEQRKRRRVQLTLAATAVGLIAVAGFGAIVVGLWRSAEQAKGVAEFAQEEAETARMEAEAARERLARVEYGRTIQVAYREWLDNNAGATIALLASTRPDLRGWEYHYLHGLCNTQIVTLKRRALGFYSAAFSPDGSRVVLSGSDPMPSDGRTRPEWTVWVCDAKTGAEVFAFKVPDSPGGEAAFSPDGTQIFVAGLGRTVRVLDARSGTAILTRTFDTGRDLNTMGYRTWFSPDGTRVITLSLNGQIRVCDTKTGAEDVTLLKGTRPPEPKKDQFVLSAGGGAGVAGVGVRSAAFNPDGSRFVFGGWVWVGDGRVSIVRVWDTRTGAEVLNLKGDRAVERPGAFSPDGSRFLAAGGDGTVRVLDASTGAEVLALKGHTRQVWSAAFSPDGSRVVTGGFDGTARVWDAKTGTAVLVLKGHSGLVGSTTFSPDGLRVLTASNDGTARVWDARTGAEFPPINGHTSEVLEASFSPDGSRVLTAGRDGMVRVRGAKTGAELRAWAFGEDKGRRNSVAFSPDATKAVTSNDEGKIQVWDTLTGAELLALKGFPGSRGFVSGVAFNPGGSRIAAAVTVETGGKVRVWDTNTGAELLAFTTPPFQTSPSFSHDGSRLVTADIDSIARVWNARTGAELLAIKSPGITSIAFGPDGSRIVTGGRDGTARIWDAKSGAEELVLRGHTDSMNSASFSPDESRIVTGSSDGTARLWDAASGVELMTLKGHTGAVSAAAFSPDGAWIVTGDASGMVRLWGVRPVKQPAR